MYPDLSYVFHDLIGTDYDNWLAIFKTFGLLLATSLVTSGFILYKEFQRLEQPGGPFHSAIVKIQHTVGAAPTWKDVLPGSIVGFIIGFKIMHVIGSFEAFKSNPVRILFSFDGNILFGLLGALLLGGLYYWDKHRQKLDSPRPESFDLKPSDRVGDIVVIAALSGVLGAKLFAMVEELGNIKSFQDFLDQLLSGSGLAIYGGLIGGFICVMWYIKTIKIPPLKFLDTAAPGLALALGIGRLGCHFSGDGDWGIQAAAQPDWWFLPDWLWSWDYPRNVNEGRTGVKLGETPPVPIPVDCDGCKYQWKLGYKVYPTSIYEFFMFSGIFGFLWSIRKKVAIPGMIFFLYMVLNGVERWFIEKVRVNDIFMWGLTQAELISIGFFTIGMFGLGILYARNKN